MQLHEMHYNVVLCGKVNVYVKILCRTRVSFSLSLDAILPKASLPLKFLSIERLWLEACKSENFSLNGHLCFYWLTSGTSSVR